MVYWFFVSYSLYLLLFSLIKKKINMINIIKTIAKKNIIVKGCKNDRCVWNWSLLNVKM